MSRVRRLTLWVVLAAILCSTLPTSVSAEILKAARGDRQEFYKISYDKESNKSTVTGEAGVYADEVAFKKIDEKDGIEVYVPEGKSIKLSANSDSSNDPDAKGCDAMPTLRWQDDQTDDGQPITIKDEDRKPVLKLFVKKSTGEIKTLITGENFANKDESDAFDNDASRQFQTGYDDYGSRDQSARTGRVYWGDVLPIIRYGIDDAQEIKRKMPKSTNGYSIQRDDRERYDVPQYLYEKDGRDARSSVHGLLSAYSSKMGISEEDPLKARIDNFNKLIADGTIRRNSDDINETVLGSEGTLVCKPFSFYTHFWRYLTPYNSFQVRLGPVAGKVLGLPDMKFEDWVRNGDNRLNYLAYKNSAQDASTRVCARKDDTFACINKLEDVRLQCLAAGIEAPNVVDASQVDNIKDPVWEKGLDETKFKDCYKAKAQELIDAKYFATEKEVEAFAKKILSNTIKPASLNPEKADAAETPKAASSDTQCSIGMLGWWMCPVLSFVSAINDKVFLILRNWLVLAPFSIQPQGVNQAAYETWNKVRNLGNIAFIFAFLYIIYAQISGRGSSPGGIRTRVPRLIIAAVLVNVSYIICGVVVDISNVVGDSLALVLMNTTITGVEASQYGYWEKVVADITLKGGAAAGTIAVVGSLAALLPLLFTGAIALIGTFLMLLFRQAITILLIVISPLAFAALALPITENLFDKWKKLFLQMMYLYPGFVILFAGGNFAAEVIRAQAVQNDDTLMMIFSLGIQILPLFAIPYFIKLMSSAVASFAGQIDKATQGIKKKVNDRATDYADYRKDRQRTRALNGRIGFFGYGAAIRANERRKAKRLNQKGNAHHAGQHLAGASDIERSADMAVGMFAADEIREAAKQALRADEDKAAKEAMEAAYLRAEASENTELIGDLTQRALNSQTEHGQKAADIKRIIESKDVGAIDQLLDNLDKFNEFEKKVMVETIEASGVAAQAAHLGNAKNLRSILSTADGQSLSGGVSSLYQQSAQDGDFTATAMAGQSAATFRGIARASGPNGSLSTEQFTAIAANYRKALGNEKLRNSMHASARGMGDSIFTGRGGRP